MSKLLCPFHITQNLLLADANKFKQYGAVADQISPELSSEARRHNMNLIYEKAPCFMQVEMLSENI